MLYSERQEAKVVKISAGTRGGYSRHTLRLILGNPGSVGYKHEKNSRILRESAPFYRSNGTKRSYEGRMREFMQQEADGINARLALGFAIDTPSGIIEDWFADLAGIA